jgi:hypothetical protein
MKITITYPIISFLNKQIEMTEEELSKFEKLSSLQKAEFMLEILEKGTPTNKTLLHEGFKGGAAKIIPTTPLIINESK